MKSLHRPTPHLIYAALAVLVLNGACSNRSQGLAGGQAADAWKTPDRHWAERLKKKTVAGEAPIAAAGRTYHASPEGSDDNAGDSGHPWRTLQRASMTMEPGDTLLIHDGEYPGGLKQRTPGAPGRPITYRAVNVGKAIVRGDQAGPVYSGRRQPAGARRANPNPAVPGRTDEPARDSLFITFADHVVVEGLVVRGAPRAGIRVDQSNNVTVRWCRFLQNGTWGIFSDFSDDLLLEYNECAYSEKQHGIYVSNSGDRPVVRYNVCHDNRLAGLQLNGDAKQRKPQLGKRGDGIIEDAVIEGNVIYENGAAGAAAINLACVHNGRIVNNLIYNNLSGGIALFNDHRRDFADFGSKRNKILHNTIYFRPGQGRFCISLKHGSTDNVIRNNILSAGRFGAFEYDDLSSFSSDYNVLWSAGDAVLAANEYTNKKHRPEEWKREGKNDQHSVWSEPQFASIKNGDFRPLASSPAVGKAADEAGVVSDVDGKPRGRGAKRSIGALEGPGK
jgi:hypothetical protein